MATTAPSPDSSAAYNEGDFESHRTIGCYSNGRCFGGHTTLEAGLSFWVHPYILAVTRFASAIALLVLAIFMSIRNRVGTEVYMVAGTVILQAVTFLMLGICTVLAAVGRGAGALPSVVIPLYQTASTLALFTSPLALLTFYFQEYAYLPPVVLFLLDTSILGARIRFRLAYIWLPNAVALILLAIVLRMDARYFLPTLIVWCVLAALLAIALTALTGHFGERKDARQSQEEVVVAV